MDISDAQIQSVINDPKLSNKKKLDTITELCIREGFIINLRTDNQLILIKKKKFSFILAMICLFFVFPLIIYILWFLAKKDKQINITLPDDSNSQKQVVQSTIQNQVVGSTADEILKLSELLRKGFITKEEFELQKQKILAS